MSRRRRTCSARTRTTSPRRNYLPALFLCRSLGRGERFEALVRDRLPALDREAVRAAGESRFGPIDCGQLLAQVVGQSRVELVLVEVGREARRILLLRQLARVLVTEPGQRAFDALSLGGQKLSGPFGIHRATLSDRAPGEARHVLLAIERARRGALPARLLTTHALVARKGRLEDPFAAREPRQLPLELSRAQDGEHGL